MVFGVIAGQFVRGLRKNIFNEPYRTRGRRANNIFISLYSISLSSIRRNGVFPRPALLLFYQNISCVHERRPNGGKRGFYHYCARRARFRRFRSLEWRGESEGGQSDFQCKGAYLTLAKEHVLADRMILVPDNGGAAIGFPVKGEEKSGIPMSIACLSTGAALFGRPC